MKHRVSALIVLLLLLGISTRAHGKDVYQTTKLLELIGNTDEFCFVVKLDDLAYVAVARSHPPKYLVVGDPIQLKIKGEKVEVKDTSKDASKWYYNSDDFNARIVSRKRMTGDASLPTCALAVKIR